MTDADLANHVLEELAPNLWRCAAPGTWIFGFHVFVGPRVVFLFGDLGELALCHQHPDSLAWILTSPNMDYALGKATATWGPKHEFDIAEARQHLDDWEKEARDENPTLEGRAADQLVECYENVREQLDFAEEYGWQETQRAWYEACRDNDIDDPPECEKWPDQLVAQWRCLQAFVRLYRAAHELDATPAPAQPAAGEAETAAIVVVEFVPPVKP